MPKWTLIIVLLFLPYSEKKKAVIEWKWIGISYGFCKILSMKVSMPRKWNLRCSWLFNILLVKVQSFQQFWPRFRDTSGQNKFKEFSLATIELLHWLTLHYRKGIALIKRWWSKLGHEINTFSKSGKILGQFWFHHVYTGQQFSISIFCAFYGQIWALNFARIPGWVPCK